jgi:signal transduction histidine kinase
MSNVQAIHYADGTTFPVDAVAVVHDLGNLIQIASSAVNIIARNPSIHDAGLEPVLAGAKTSLERAGALVRQTIGIASGPCVEERRISLADVVAEITALIRLTWDRSVRRDLEAAADLPFVRCDPLGLQNAILNVLLNARQAMPDGGTISLRTAPISLGPLAAVELSVTDTGVGMKPDTIARAFDPFFTTRCDGLGGIGLPMVERFARDAGGRISIESEFGVGTTVRLQLPASAPARNPASLPGQES